MSIPVPSAPPLRAAMTSDSARLSIASDSLRYSSVAWVRSTGQMDAREHEVVEYPRSALYVCVPQAYVIDALKEFRGTSTVICHAA